MVHLKQPSPTTDLDQAASVFVQHRARLFAIAYRVLGSTAEAEDVVQEVWTHWQESDRSAVLSPAAFLSTTTARAALDAARSARVRRESYIGPWLPEPLDTSADREMDTQAAEAMDPALLLVLDAVSPTERAAYILREAFDYTYAAIAETLQLSLLDARKSVCRAREHVKGERRESAATTGWGRPRFSG
ncbi:sigma factor [Streptomyces sp. NPDC059651]|uniref:sigma factor n=1 Tax=Streptomyces sp. NPDC059651 TaxID=3346897 RepID=UPI0036868918